MVERIPYSTIVDETPQKYVAMVRALMCILLSRHRDYHDTKALPMMTIEQNAAECELTEEQTEFAKRAIRLTSFTRAELYAAGFDLPETDDEYNDGAEVSFPHRKMIYLAPQDIYIDLNQTGRVFVYR